jgi:peptidoglycan/LPS O-acetylase OafA/YrhL
MNRQAIAKSHLDWLDLLRVLCAIEIAGVHWLRACIHVGLLTNTNLPSGFRNFVWSYKNTNVGFQMLKDFPNYFLLDNQNDTAAILSNTVGFLFGFGWEALSIFIFISGFSLTLKLTNWPDRAKTYWLGWYKRRFRRILFPYYFIVVILLSTFFAFYLTINLLHIPFFEPIQAKLQTKIDADWANIFISHIFLVNPWQPHGSATFFAPAWWFLPAIIVAYIFFPLYSWLLIKLGSKFLLISSFLVTITAYWLETQNILLGNQWYFIITFELFNFSLGIIFGRWFQNESTRNRITSLLFCPSAFMLGLLLFAIGNFMNWFVFLYPFSSVFFTFGLIIVGANLSKFLLQVPFFSQLKSVDAYLLYLLHQPFAYLIALVLSRFLHRYTPFFGIIIYICFVLFVTSIFSKIYASFESRLSVWATEHIRYSN